MSAKAGRRLLNLVLWVLFVELLAYRPGSGLYRHALLGCLWLALLVLHLILNRAWFATVFKPPFVPVKTLFVAVNVLLIAGAAAMAAGAAGLSGSIVAWSPFSPTHAAREWHHLGAFACFFAITLHAGLHGQYLLKQSLSRLPSFISIALQGLIVISGLLVLVFGTVAAPLWGEPVLGRGLTLWRYWAECAILTLFGAEVAYWMMQEAVKRHLRILRQKAD